MMGSRSLRIVPGIICFSVVLSVGSGVFGMSRIMTGSKEEIKIKQDLKENGENSALLTKLGESYWKRGRRRAAIRLFSRAISAAPLYAPPHFFLGKGYFFQGKTDEGIKQFGLFEDKMDRMVGRNKGYKDFYTSSLRYIGYMYTTVKRYDEVLRVYKKIVNISPEDQRTHYNLAVCYYKFFQNRPMAYNELIKTIDLDKDSKLADMARFFIEYIRNNPDPRYLNDFTFIGEKD